LSIAYSFVSAFSVPCFSAQGMDQQYDLVKINQPGECFAFTVEEAESLGFRRAFKWHSI